MSAMCGNKGILEFGRFSVPYRVYGKTGPFILCVNGVQQSMISWRPFISKLSNEARIIAFDFPGQGKGKINSGDIALTIDEQVSVIKELLDCACDNEPVNIVAASWGGVIAAAYASRYPSRVTRMILGSFGTRVNKKMFELICKGQVLHNAGHSEAIGELIVEGFGNQIPEFYKRQIVEQFKSISPHNLQAFYSHCELVASVKNVGNEIDFKNITAKTVIVNGECDTIIDLEDAKEAAEKIPGCTINIIPNTGHFLFFEKEELIDQYKDFILGK